MAIWKKRKEINFSTEDFSLLDKICQLRGIQGTEELQNLNNRVPQSMLDPFQLMDLQKACTRLLQAKERNEKILIFGDYDVDGTTSVSLVYGYLLEMGFNVSYYIPDRYKEGYGFSQTGAEYAIAENFQLIITLDCGTKDGVRIDFCKAQGIDVIVCDHHTPEEHPNAIAFINPKRKDCSYPNKGLSGCGVGFKLMQGLNRTMQVSDNRLYYYLDLVALSTAADIVPFTPENQLMVYFGLRVMNKKLRPGLQAMFNLSKSKSTTIGVQELVFIFAPRVNAAGRIYAGKRSVDLMLSEQLNLAEEIASEIETYNRERRALDENITKEALALIEGDEFSETSKVNVVYHKNWHKGVIGIVASRIIEKYYKPTIVLTEIDGQLSGSCRSIPGIDIYEILNSCAGLLTQFGGHSMAAGLS
ncbi:MAG: single-stranded-DNA-specific exonuclease RecJ, partial [Bacteroidota bacterium]